MPTGRPTSRVARHDELDRRMPELAQRLWARRRAMDRRATVLGVLGAVGFVAFLVVVSLLSG